jgi:hypothetical protein
VIGRSVPAFVCHATRQSDGQEQQKRRSAARCGLLLCGLLLCGLLLSGLLLCGLLLCGLLLCGLLLCGLLLCGLLLCGLLLSGDRADWNQGPRYVHSWHMARWLVIHRAGRLSR